MTYTLFKAVHIIFIVSYFAGLFYMIRLYIYHVEALAKQEPDRTILCDQFSIMEKRLWNIITVPSAAIVVLSGASMLYLRADYLLAQPWIHIKLSFVFLLAIYHFLSWRMLRNLKINKLNVSSLRLRMFNEVATLLLFLIVFVAILKSEFLAHWYWAFLAFVAIGVLIMLIVRLLNSKSK